MQEIEIKFRVQNLLQIENSLTNNGCTFSKELNQKDVIFVPNIKDTSNKDGNIFVRIRKSNENIELNLKKRSSNLIQAKEIEFNIDNFEAANDFLETLGLYKWVTVEKQRKTTKYKNFNICIDTVKGLGNFIEIEIITFEDDKVDYYEEEIIKIAKELGINIEDREYRLYDSMIDELEKKDTRTI